MDQSQHPNRPMIDHISIQRQGEMADAVKHAIVAMICAKHLSLFFTVLVLEFKFKSNSKWMMKTITTTTKPRMPFSLFSATRKANQARKKANSKSDAAPPLRHRRPPNG
jgi:hypothetical protein